MEMQVVRNPNVNPMARPMRLAASPEAPRRQVELEEGKEGTSVGLAPHHRPRQSPTNLSRPLVQPQQIVVGRRPQKERVLIDKIQFIKQI